MEVSYRSEFKVLIIAMIVISYLICTITARRVNKLGWAEALGFGLLCTLVTTYLLVNRQQIIMAVNGFRGTRENDFHLLARILLAPVIPTLGPFLLMIIQKGRGTNLSPEEQLPGAAGLRAWLSPRRLLWIGLFAAAFAVWGQVSVVVTAAILIGLLCIAPVVKWAMTTEKVEKVGQVNDPIAPEREKVLNMIAAKQISPEDGAELLSALAMSSSAAARRQPVALTPARQMIFAGALIVIIAFFLPWFSYNPGQELSRLMGQMSATMSNNGVSQIQQTLPGGVDFQVAGANIKTTTMHVSGGRIPSGLGWIILIAAVAVAAVGFFADRLDPQTRRMVEMGAFAVGAFLLLYILSDSIRYASFGIFMVFVGYICQALGLIREWKTTKSNSGVTTSVLAN